MEPKRVGTRVRRSLEPRPIHIHLSMEPWLGSLVSVWQLGGVLSFGLRFLKESCIRWGPDPLMGRGNFKRERLPVVKYRDALPWAV